jgi:hypothetical protein
MLFTRNAPLTSRFISVKKHHVERRQIDIFFAERKKVFPGTQKNNPEKRKPAPRAGIGRLHPIWERESSYQALDDTPNIPCVSNKCSIPN